MKKLISLLTLMSLCVSGALAQTIFVMGYTDPNGAAMKSLVFYNGDDGETSEVRTIRLDNPSQIAVHEYRSQFYEGKKRRKGADDISYTIMTSNDDTEVAPTFVFWWDPEETYVHQRNPYLVFDDDWDFEDYLRADYFNEVSLLDMNSTLISQFYYTSDPMYKRLLDAHNMAVQQEAELVRTLGDGSDLYRTLCDLYYDTSAGNPTLQDIMQNFYADYYRVFGMKASQDNNTYGTEANTVQPLRKPEGGRRNPLLDDDEDPDYAPEATLHLIFLANTEISDIGQAVGTDLRRICSEMKGVCSKLELTYRQYIVSGMDFGRDALVKQLDAVKPQENDIVMFVYSGHGFRWQDQTDPYPQLALVTDDYTDIRQTGNYVSLSDIDREVAAKGARLTIVLADCCNSVYGQPSPLPLGSNTLLSRGNTNLSTERLRSLFLGQAGHIICTASSPGEVSWCSQAGGNFTCNFIESFRREINLLSDNASASWESILDATVQNTRKYAEQNSLSAQNAVKEVTVLNVKQ